MSTKNYKPIIRLSLMLLTLCLSFEPSVIKPVLAGKEDTAIYEDNLTTSNGLRWGGSGLPYRKAVDIKDSLVNTPLGKVTADRYIDNPSNTDVQGNTISLDFSDVIMGSYYAPKPGKTVFISLWGSKIEGCFVEIVIQNAPSTGQPDMSSLVPKLLEIGIGSQLIELPPQSTAQPKVFSQAYTYTVGSTNVQTPSTWYMTRNLFVVDSTIANILRNAPNSEARARITMQDGRKVLVPVKKETAAAWNQAYSFNPSCQSAESVAKQRQLSDQPLLGAFASYSGSQSQDEALDWLQRQINPTTFAQFGNQWRGKPLSTPGKPIRLVDAGKFYKGVRQQKAAIEWLQKKIPEDILKAFVEKWN